MSDSDDDMDAAAASIRDALADDSEDAPTSDTIPCGPPGEMACWFEEEAPEATAEAPALPDIWARRGVVRLPAGVRDVMA